LAKEKEPNTNVGKIAWTKKAKRAAGGAFEHLMYEQKLEKMANTIYKSEYEMLEEAPFGAGDRKFMYDAARRAQKILQEEKINLTLADIQAALWYYEKRLYAKLSGRKADDIGYEEAIIKQSNKVGGRPRPSVVFDRGVNTGNVAAGESETSDGDGGLPAGGTEKLSLRALPNQVNAVTESNMPPKRDGFTRLYHGGHNEGFTQVPGGGSFDGFFASARKSSSWQAHGSDKNYFADVPDDKVLTDYALNYEVPYQDTLAAFEKVTGIKEGEDNFGAAWSAVVEDKGNRYAEEAGLADRSGNLDDPGLVAQKLRGQVAKELGFQAVEMEDEHGTSWLIVPGTPLTRVISDEQSASGNSDARGREAGIKFSLRAPDTKEFKQFFGDSKVVDENGDPLVVYHGTTKDFNEFIIAKKANRGNNPDGFYFTSSANEASEYAQSKDNASVMPVFLNIENPFVGDSPVNQAMVNQFEKELRKDNPNLGDSWIKEKLETFKERGKRKNRWFPEIFPNITFPTNAMTRVLEAGGYDGFRDGGNHWMAVNSNQVKSATGNIGTYDRKNPDIRYSLRSTLPASVTAAIDRTTVARVNKGFGARMMAAFAPTAFSKYRQLAINRYNALGAADKALADKLGSPGLLADQSAEAAALMSDLGASITASVLGKHDRVGGIPVYIDGRTIVTNLNNTVGGPLHVFAPLAKYGDPYIYQMWQFWAAVNRAKPHIKTAANPNGKEIAFQESDIIEANRLEALYPEFKPVQKEWLKFNNGLVDYLVSTGVISEKARDLWIKHSDYVPFYRQMEGEETIGPKLFQPISGVTPPKKYKGGTEAPLADFLETIVRNTQSAIQMGIKNAAAQRAVSNAFQLNNVGQTDFIEPVFGDVSKKNVVNVLVNGQKRSYRCIDSLWMDAMQSLNLPDLPFMGLLSGPANLLRSLVTKDPGFMLANMLRDSLAAYTTSGVKDMKPIVSTIMNFAGAIAGKSPTFNTLLNAGILGGHEYSNDIIHSAQTFAKDLREKTGTRTASEKALSPVTGIWEALEKGTTASDAATRIDVYEKTLAATNNETEALFRALEVMNFNRKGSAAIIRVATAAIPFLNARVQGLDVLYRTSFGKTNSANAKEAQKRFFIRGATMLALSCMYWTLTHDEDDYKKQEQETKDNNWLFPWLGIRVPIPFEIGIIFKVIPERIMALSFGTDTAKDFRESMTRQLISTLAIQPIPQTGLPLVEAVTNYSFFTGRPIVGSGMEGVEAGYQVGPSTSRIAADIGKAVGYSPMKIDHLVNGYTGTMGMYMFGAMDTIWSMQSDIPRASKRFEQTPVLKRFLVDPEARGTVTAYYAMKNSTDAMVRTAGLLERTMNFKELAEYQKENMKSLSTHEFVNNLEKSMKQFRELRLMVNSSKMSGDSKRDSLKSITQAENHLTSNIQTIKKSIQ
jgi:hypothetical protein